MAPLQKSDIDAMAKELSKTITAGILSTMQKQWEDMRKDVEENKKQEAERERLLQKLAGQVRALQGSVNEMRVQGGTSAAALSSADSQFAFKGTAEARDLFISRAFQLPLQPISTGAVQAICTGASADFVAFARMLAVKDLSKGRCVDAPRILEYVLQFAAANGKGALALRITRSCRRSSRDGRSRS